MFEELKERWDEILDYFKQEYNIVDVTFKTWILPLRIKSFDNDLLTLVYTGVGGTTGLHYIINRYSELLKVSIEEIFGTDINLKIVLGSESDVDTDLPDTKKNYETIRLEKRIEESNLNSSYTFDTFVVGSNNNSAQLTSLVVAESPGEVYNPLFIYGGSGLGKTHLLHSIGNYVLQNDPDAKVLYTTSEAFINEVIDLLRAKHTSQEDFINFRKKYRSVDVLLIDDIQFFANKERSQEELFNIFNNLFINGKQIVITSDIRPKLLTGIPERLVSRFEQGLTVDIHNPDYETRMAILRKKAEQKEVEVSDDVLDYIANHCTSNVRELEGSLTRIVAYARISHEPITVDFAIDALKEYISSDSQIKVNCESIINMVADHFQVSVSELYSNKRSRELTYPRQVCMYLCRMYTNENLKTIATLLKRKNHATISYGCDKIKKMMEEDPSVRSTVEVLKKKITSD